MVGTSQLVSEPVVTRPPRSGYSRVLVSTVVLQIVAVAPLAIYTAMQSRLLGAAGRGEVALVVTTAAFAAAIADLGYNAAMPYRAGQARERPELLLWNFCLWSALSLPLVFVGIAILASWDQPQGMASLFQQYALYLGLLMVSGLIHLFVQYEALSMRDFTAYNALSAISHLSMVGAFGLTYYFAPATLSVETALLSYCFGYIVSSVAVGVLARSRLLGYLRKFGVSLRGLVEHLQSGLKPFVSGMVERLIARLDIFILIAFGGDIAAVGYYSVAMVLLQLFEQVPYWMGLTLVPKSAHNDPDVRSLTIGLASASMVAATAAIVVYLVLGPVLPNVITLVFGPGFGIVYFILLLMMPRALFKSVGEIIGGNLAGRGYTRYYPIASLVGLSVNIISNLLLIPHYGVFGAAASQSITQLFQVSILVFGFCRINNVGLRGLILEAVPIWKQILPVVRSRLTLLAPRR